MTPIQITKDRLQSSYEGINYMFNHKASIPSSIKKVKPSYQQPI
jgi:hypothetical protein